MISQIYEIYSVPSYLGYVLENPKKGSEIAERFSSESYKNIIKELKNDKQYHLNVRKDDMLKVNIDIDGMKKYKFPNFKTRLLKYFASIGVTEDLDVSYTKNNNGEKNIETNTKDYLYSHFTIINLCATSSKQKELWEGFINKYPQYKDICDHKHLGKEKGWFRLPKQTKEGVAGTKHEIIAGEMKYFILHYIPKKCVNIDHLIIPVKPKEEKPVNPEFEKNVDEKDEKLVELLD